MIEYAFVCRIILFCEEAQQQILTVFLKPIEVLLVNMGGWLGGMTVRLS